MINTPTRQNSLTVYGWKTMKKGDTFPLSKDKVISMKNSLRSYNKAHHLNIKIDYEPITEGENNGKILCTCIDA